jgi:tRNA (guanine9-N1)-methyltransferase
MHKGSWQEVFQDMKGDLLYLSADAVEELEKLTDGQGYIIGGIVDRNRYKGLCSDIADKAGIQAARLPIEEHMKLVGSKVRFTTLSSSSS